MSSEEKNNKLRGILWRYYAFAFLKVGLFAGVLVPFFTDFGNLSLFQVQLIQSWFMVWLFILEVPTGAVADYFGRKNSLAIGALVAVFGVLIYGSTNRLAIFLLGEFLLALAMALISGADDALVYDALKEVGKEDESKKIFGRAHSMQLAGMFVAAPIGSLIAARFGLNFPMLFSSIPFIAAAFLAWTIKEPKLHSTESESKRYLKIVREGFVFFYLHKTLRLLALDGIVVATAAYFVLWLYQPLLKSVSVPIVYFGFVHAALVAVEILIASNFVFLENLFDSTKKFLRISAALVALGFVVVAAFPSLTTVLIFTLIAGGFGLTRIELMLAYMQRFIPSPQRATVLSSISMFQRVGLFLLNPFVGFAADQSLRLPLFALTLLPLLVFLFSPLEHEMFEDQ